MAIRSKLLLIQLICLVIILLSCEKKEVPTITTSDITNITGTTATSGGTITNEGSGTVVERGVCWSKGISPTIADKRTVEGGGAGTFISHLTELEPATTYYVKAYAKNEAGIGYGMAMSFKTEGEAPNATTQAATNITVNSATLNGIVNPNYLSSTVSFEYGTTTAYGQTISASQSPITGDANTSVTAEINGLTPGKEYHFRVKTNNALGTAYGEDASFLTLGQTPTAITQSATNLSSVGARLNGMVNANYLSTEVIFEYGTTTAYGNTITAIPSPVTGSSSTIVSADISGLNLGTIYHFRVKAENSLGTTIGDDMSFRIPPPPPTNGLVAYYPLNGNANDQTTNANHGTVSGAILTVDRFGSANSAYYFDGVNDDISGTTNNWPFNKTPRTISIWGKLSSLPNFTNAILLTYGVAQPHSSNSIYFQLVTGQKKVLYVAYQDDISANYDYNVNQWYHFVGTYDGTVATLYINGALVVSENKPDWNNLPADFHIGSLDNWTSWLNGVIDDIRIYNRVLSQEEILSLYYELP